LEEKLDEKTAQLIHLQRVLMEHQANSPVKSTELVQALGEWGSEKALANGGDMGGRGGKGDRAGERGGGKGGGNAPLPPHMLLSYKQFPRHPAATLANGTTPEVEVASGAGGGGREMGESALLSAEDKISELSRMADHHHVERQVLLIGCTIKRLYYE
jgi:hypothetical protein